MHASIYKDGRSPRTCKKKNALCAAGEGTSASLALSPKVPKELNRSLSSLIIGHIKKLQYTFYPNKKGLKLLTL
jgi:hypothetical protein